MNNTSLLVVIVLATVVLMLMFLRTRKSGAKTMTPRRLAERAAEEEAAAMPKESEWKLRDLGVGGKIHASLPKGLEEDYTVLRRDRLVWPDEQIEYDLRLAGDDPNHDVRIHWWTIGVYTYAWMLEAEEHGSADLGLSAESLEEMRASGKGTCRFRDQIYTLNSARSLILFEGGMRPGKDVVRWDFRNDQDTRQIVIQRNERGEGEYHVLRGREVWLRDLTIIQARAAASSEASAKPPTGETEHLS